MNRSLATLCLFVLAAYPAFAGEYAPRDGDVIFHTSTSPQSAAIQEATNSEFSHVGIIYVRDGKPYVFEAFNEVTLTPLKRWVRRGKDGRYVVRRLREADKLLTTEVKKQMYDVGMGFKGKPYDPYFQWNDDAIYCSELVWKIYEKVLKLEIGKRQTLKDFDLSLPETQKLFKKRFGGRFPKDEKVISPAAMFVSPLLKTVFPE